MDGKCLEKITINNLSWKYNNKTILDDISLEFEKNKIYGVLGPNGAGKTSLVKHILGFGKHYQGEILYNQIDINDISRSDFAKKIAFLPQNINQNADFLVYDIISMGREPYRKRFRPLDGEDISKIEEAIKFTSCEEFVDKSVCQISGGELQRVMIARTMAQDTPWIVLDEPVSSLDIKHQTELMNLLLKLKEDKGKTIIMIVHDINMAAQMCDDIILMKKGSVAFKGNTENALTEEKLRDVFGVDFYKIKGEMQKEYIAPRISL